MNIADLLRANALAERRIELLDHKRDINERDRLGVTIFGTYQDKAFVDAVRPAALAEIDRRIAEIDAELTSLGVDLS